MINHSKCFVFLAISLESRSRVPTRRLATSFQAGCGRQTSPFSKSATSMGLTPIQCGIFAGTIRRRHEIETLGGQSHGTLRSSLLTGMAKCSSTIPQRCLLPRFSQMSRDFWKADYRRRLLSRPPSSQRKLRRASSAAGHDRCDRGCCTMDWLKLFQVVSTSLKASQHLAGQVAQMVTNTMRLKFKGLVSTLLCSHAFSNCRASSDAGNSICESDTMRVI